jgi:signal transduction histidine kinase
MKYRSVISNIVLSLLTIFTLWACSGYTATVDNHVYTDSISLSFHSFRYSSIDSLDTYASMLSNSTASESDLYMESCNAKAYVAMMNMNYGGADSLYSLVLRRSNCEIERLVASVGLMTLDYRVSASRRFFDHRSVALELIKRINEETEFLSASERDRFLRAKVEFCVVSVCYFANLGMLDEKKVALHYLNTILNDIESVPLRIYARMIVENNNNDSKERLNSLLLGLNVANSYKLKWLQANYKLLLSITLRDSLYRNMLVHELPERFKMFALHDTPLDEIPKKLASEAKDDFKEYGDSYMMTEAIVVAASCDIQSGNYSDAIVQLDSALAEINGYYRKFYPDSVSLFSNSLQDLYNEANFTTDVSKGIYNIPECLLSVRREASSAYAGMNDKKTSDINREAYLELLRTTRMNKQFESRAYSAETQSSNMRNWIVMLVLMLSILVFFLLILYKSRLRYRRTYSVELKRLLEVCRGLISSLPHDVLGKKMLCETIVNTLNTSLSDFSGDTVFEIVDSCEQPIDEHICLFKICYMNIVSDDCLKVTSSLPLSSEKQCIITMAVPYIAVAIEEGMRLAGITEEHEKLEEQRKSYALYLAGHKRENMLKRVSLSVVGAMRPFMDRLLKELDTLPVNQSPSDEERKLRYIDELTGKLDDLNIILERWIKMRQGELNLHIETFAVSDVFSIIKRSEHLLKNRGIILNICECDQVVKADRALTLFMLNTLVDNASKFTPSGGTVTVGCDPGDSFVELYVSDTGIGISQTDINRILSEKVYDASLIGADNDMLQPKSKGGGFGLMNCKGIIEKYRKTDSVFSVCSMNITGCKGSGSRFSFRLPKGIINIIVVLLMFLPSSLLAYNNIFLHIGECADSVYNSNVDGNHEEAFVQAQKALDLINSYYISTVGGSDTLMLDSGNAAELTWWREGLFPDELKEDIYFNILDVRNELAVASLALQRWHSYRYNNYIYSTLYRLVHEDTGISDRYESMQRSLNIWQAAVALLSLLFVLLVIYVLLSYVRFNIIERKNERMVIDVNGRLLRVATGDTRMSVQELADGMLREFYYCMGENMRMKSAAIVLCDTFGNQFLSEVPGNTLHGRSDIYMYGVLENCEEYISSDGLLRVYPLCVTNAGKRHVVGVLEVVTERSLGENEVMTLDLVIGYLASVAFHAVVRMANRYVALEDLEEEAARMKFEENRLHVKNMVIDNCLSVIKHETIYYPSRVRELACRALADTKERSASVVEMRELMGYYSSIFGILSNCAMREIIDTPLSISQVKLSDLFEDAVRYLVRRSRRLGLDISLKYEQCDESVSVDADIVAFLFETLLDAAMRVNKPGVLLLRAIACDDVVRVELVDERIVLTSEEVADLFTPTEKNITNNGVIGMEYIIAKEIVRLHEDYTGKYGGRMEARSDVSGTIIIFTLPK